jgi:lysophospholipase L1-like esterase
MTGIEEPNMKRITTLAALAVLTLNHPSIALAAEPVSFALGQEETIVFVGDSITQGPIQTRGDTLMTKNGFYTLIIDNYLTTRFPERKFRFINSGNSAETLSGLSESHHPGPRPCLFNRFDRTVAVFAPTLVIACYGINDGIYSPFSEARFTKYQEGVKRLDKLVREDLKARLLILTPPFYDSLNAGLPDVRPEESYGYKQPFADYDLVLEKYAAWLLTLPVPGLFVADVHSQMAAHAKSQRNKHPGYRLSGDSIHPSKAGHLIMALAALEALHAPALVDEARIDAAKNQAVAGQVGKLRVEGGAVAFEWTSKLPMTLNLWDYPAMEASAVAETASIIRFNEKLNRHVLQVTGLTSAKYRLLADDVEVGTFTREALAQGLDLTAVEKFPTTARSRAVPQLVMKRRQISFDFYRKSVAEPEATRLEREQTMAAVSQKLHDLCQPLPMRIRLVAADKPENPAKELPAR